MFNKHDDDDNGFDPFFITILPCIWLVVGIIINYTLFNLDI